MKLLKVYLHVRNKYRQHRHIYTYIYDVVVLVYITFVVHDAQMYCVYIKIIYENVFIDRQEARIKSFEYYIILYKYNSLLSIERLSYN